MTLAVMKIVQELPWTRGLYGTSTRTHNQKFHNDVLGLGIVFPVFQNVYRISLIKKNTQQFMKCDCLHYELVNSITIIIRQRLNTTILRGLVITLTCNNGLPAAIKKVQIESVEVE